MSEDAVAKAAMAETDDKEARAVYVCSEFGACKGAVEVGPGPEAYVYTYVYVYLFRSVSIVVKVCAGV